MRKRRFLSAVLVLFLAVALLHGTAEAATIQGTCGDDITWTLQAGTLTISGSGPMYENRVLPPWYDFWEQITTVVIKPGVTTIGRAAFRDCVNLTKITIPEDVTAIGVEAFYGCSGLTKLQIPQGITGIEEGTFLNCSGLKEVILPEGITHIGYQAFASCSSLTDIHIPDSVTTLDGEVFSNCSSLTSIQIPVGITVLESNLFSNCSSLTDVTIPDTVTVLGNGVFGGCSALTEIQLPLGVTEIGDDAFYGCASLTGITLPEGITKIGRYGFYGCSNLTEITLPRGVTSVESYIFGNCTALTQVTIPEGVTRIGTYAFSNCSSLTELRLPNGVLALDDRALDFCVNLTTLHLPASITRIGRYVLTFCSKLTDVYYDGTEAQWQKVSKEMYNDPLYRATIHYKAVPGSFKGASLSLNGIINVNFYADIAEGVDAKVVFTINGQALEQHISEATINKGLYVFSCEMAAKQMADEITAQIYVDSEPVGEPATYSVRQYCENKLENADTKETLKNLLVAMLNYGTAAQDYFAYHTDDPANSILTDTQKQMAPVYTTDLEAFTMSISGTDAGIAKNGASLLLEADTIIRYRVQLNEGYAIEDYTFQYGDQVLTPVADPDDSSVYYVDIAGIAAKDLDKMYPITVGGLRISYGPMSYVQRQLDKATTRNVVTALYHYNQMANAYFA